MMIWIGKWATVNHPDAGIWDGARVYIRNRHGDWARVTVSDDGPVREFPVDWFPTMDWWGTKS